MIRIAATGRIVAQMFVMRLTEPLHKCPSQTSQTLKSMAFLRSRHGSFLGP